ncbi:DNA-binding MarR family transcriptional regulator [Virgibacillus natechei]|uniref:DNA-binding MarR family transcriptional regulator n=1 Tax=Virgibacillus natechei TaxID=1216297 RepID=A0ABS4IJT4_9BACI|nr:MarR family transcriptional regulator [Virgibacillus natechei]MBP1970269.1 DNA-binding MarR family transcriptional regulator [Virgibacillus natechei]UZD12787.1 MarR family transcriptional regulator [Virgibacillus natechei]
MNDNELFATWINLTKYHDRLLKAMDYTLHHQFQLGINEFYLLYFLAQTDEKKMRLSDLLPKVGLSHSALSRLVSRMEKYRGESLIERTTDEKDKRSVDVLLSEEGERLAEEMLSLLNNTLNKQLSEKDINKIKDLFD